MLILMMEELLHLLILQVNCSVVGGSMWVLGATNRYWCQVEVLSEEPLGTNVINCMWLAVVMSAPRIPLGDFCHSGAILVPFFWDGFANLFAFSVAILIHSWRMGPLFLFWDSLKFSLTAKVKCWEAKKKTTLLIWILKVLGYFPLV